MPAIEIDRLSKRFGDVAAVDDLSFVAREGAVTGFLGPNGAGKTTTLRMLLGLVAPTGGTATIGGKRYAELAAPSRHVGAVLETDAFHPGRRARNHLRVLAMAAGLPLTRVDEVLAEVGLADAGHRRVKGFSLGMRQRLGLASALLGEPQVLILDEPANGLDPEGVHWLREFLRAFADAGGTVLVSSHLLAEVAQTVDDVVIIARGRARHPVVAGRSGTALADRRARADAAGRRRCARRSPRRASPPSSWPPTWSWRFETTTEAVGLDRRPESTPSSTRWRTSTSTSRSCSSSSPPPQEPSHEHLIRAELAKLRTTPHVLGTSRPRSRSSRSASRSRSRRADSAPLDSSRRLPQRDRRGLLGRRAVARHRHPRHGGRVPPRHGSRPRS